MVDRQEVEEESKQDELMETDNVQSTGMEAGSDQDRLSSNI